MNINKKLTLIILITFACISSLFSQKRVLLINYDAVGYEELVDFYDDNSAIKKLIANGSLFEVPSIFPSNTYPVFQQENIQMSMVF